MKRLNFAAKILCTVLVLFMLAQTSAMCVSNALEATKSNDEAVLFLGDVNCDNAINAYDYVLVKRHYFKTFTLVGEQYERADINCDQIVNTYDYILIARHYFNTYVIKQPDLAHKHALALVPAKDKTCTEDGNTAYYVCNGCDKIFADEQGEIEISLESTVIAKGHNEVTVPGYPASYESEGLTSGVQCSVCQEWIEEQEVIEKLEATEHKLTFFDDKTAGYPKYESYYEHLGVDSLPNLELEGYNFLGWFDAPQKEEDNTDTANKILFIPKNSKEDYELYAHWEKIKYTIEYLESPDSAKPLAYHTNPPSYTVEDDFFITDPEWTGLSFDYWTDHSGKLQFYTDEYGIKRVHLQKGTTGNITLTANWKRMQNIAVPSTNNRELLATYDQDNKLYYYIYELGTIEHVVLSEIVLNQYKYEGVAINLELAKNIQISEEKAQSITSTVINTVSSSSGWEEAYTWAQSNSDSYNFEASVGVEFPIKAVTAKIDAHFGYSHTDSNEWSNATTTRGEQKWEDGASLGTTSQITYKNEISSEIVTSVTIPEDMPEGYYHYVHAANIRVFAIIAYDPILKIYTLHTYSMLDNMHAIPLYYRDANELNSRAVGELPFDIPTENIGDSVENSFYIVYDANTGSGNMPMTVHTIDGPSNLHKNEFTKKGYTFSGWTTSKENPTDFYPDQAEIKGIGESGKIITLYAQWAKNEYTVNFDPNGGTVSFASATYSFGDYYTSLPVPSKTGHNFLYWTLNGERVDENTLVTTAEEHTLVAQWEKGTYYIHFENPQGSLVKSIIVYYQQTVSLPVPSHNNSAYYNFTGWTLNGSPVGTEYNCTTASDITLKATWSQAYTDYTYISDRAGLERIGNNLSGKYMLISDISLSGSQWSPLGVFSGVLNGNGHTIYGLTFESVLPDSGGSYGMFSKINYATISNINFADVYIYTVNNANKGSTYYVGALAAEADVCSISNVTVSSGHISFAGSYGGKVYVGGVVGRAYACTFNNCKNSATLLAKKGDANAGGIAGTTTGTNSVKCTFNNCNNTGYIEAHLMVFLGHARAGGIVGFCLDKHYSFNNCTNTGGRKAWGDAGANYLTGEIYNT